MNRKAQKKNYMGIVIILLVLAVFGGYYYANMKVHDDVQADIGTDFPAIVDEYGNCIGREGIEMGLCCATWDTETQEEKWVLCETLVEKNLATQAFFTFEDGDMMSDVSSIAFAVKIDNTGNSPISARIKNVIVSSDAASATSESEVQAAFNTLSTEWQYMQAGASATISMNIDDRIRLQIPAGSDEFTMADGIYYITMYMETKDAQGIIRDAGSRTVAMQVEAQTYQISFSISVA